MAEFKMGFIGTGNMGSALARAAAKSGERMLHSFRSFHRSCPNSFFGISN